MKSHNISLLDGFWDRLEEEIQKQNINKTQLAERRGFERRMLYNPKRRSRYIRLVYFARICATLRVSAYYLLFGKRNDVMN